MNSSWHKKRVLRIPRLLALFLALCLSLPSPALALREEQTADSGLEERQLAQALLGSKPTLIPGRSQTLQPAAGAEEEWRGKLGRLVSILDVITERFVAGIPTESTYLLSHQFMAAEDSTIEEIAESWAKSHGGTNDEWSSALHDFLFVLTGEHGVSARKERVSKSSYREAVFRFMAASAVLKTFTSQQGNNLKEFKAQLGTNLEPPLEVRDILRQVTPDEEVSRKIEEAKRQVLSFVPEIVGRVMTVTGHPGFYSEEAGLEEGSMTRREFLRQAVLGATASVMGGRLLRGAEGKPGMAVVDHPTLSVAEAQQTLQRLADTWGLCQGSFNFTPFGSSNFTPLIA